MYDSLDMFRISASMARHAGARQAVVATNVANADTPGYRAVALPAFSIANMVDGSDEMRATRPGHVSVGIGRPANRPVPTDAGSGGAEPSPNGNTVSIETEMFNAIEAQREHSRSLAIYRHALGLIRTSLGR